LILAKMSFKQILPFIAPFVISFISAQDIQVQCGDGARSKTIPDSVYNDYDITKVVLPALRDTICPFDDQGYCALFNFCVFSTTITPPNGAPILLTINKSTEIQPGGSGNFGPCNTVMVCLPRPLYSTLPFLMYTYRLTPPDRTKYSASA
jgi:hypothetical protein